MKPSELIGKKATIIDLRLKGESLGEDNLVAGITLDIENGPRVVIEAYEWSVELKKTEEP